MSFFLGNGTDPSHTITDDNERWVSWTREACIYARKRTTTGSWGTEICLNPGCNSSIHYFDDKIHLNFEYLDKIYYRFWGVGETPIYLKPPGGLMDCARLGESNSYYHLNLPYPPTTFFRFGVDKLYWETPTTPVMGEKILGYNIYEISGGGIVKLNLELVQAGIYEHKLQNNCFYFVKTVVYSGYGQTEYLGKRSEYIYINPHEIWNGENVKSLTDKAFGGLTDFVVVTLSQEDSINTLDEKTFIKIFSYIMEEHNYEESIYTLTDFPSYKSVLYDEEGHVVG